MPVSTQIKSRFRFGVGLCLSLYGFLVSLTAQGAAPSGYSQPASRVTLSTATLHGSVVPNGTTTRAWFEWGTNASFGLTTVSTNVGSGTALIYLSQPVTGLLPQQEYRYRLVSSNAQGVVRGRVIQFATGYEISGWGTDSDGEIAKAYAITNVTALVHGLALKTDGSITAWAGRDYYGQTNVPPGLSNVLGIATTSGFSLAIRSNGTVVAWGTPVNESGQTNVPISLSNAVAISASPSHSFALKNDGRAVGWGDNRFGQANIPSIATNLIQIVAGGYSSMALRADQTIILWGDSAYGQFNAPTNMTNVVALAMGYGHSLALQADGKVHAWGWNNYGQTNVPPDVTNAIAIAAGFSESFAILADGTVRAWGHNFYKQTTISQMLKDVVAVAGENQTSYALCKKALGRPLTGTIAYTRSPQTIRPTSALLSGFVATDGRETTAWFEWGTNSSYGQTTIATNVGTSTSLIHVIASLSDLSFGGVYHCRLVASNVAGVVRGQDKRFTTAALLGKWGAAGELSVPSSPSGFVALDTGDTHDIALKSDGGVVAWGDNTYGKAAIPPGLTNISAIAASTYSSLAVTDTGETRVWGYAPSPSGLSNVLNLQATPYYNTVALFPDGQLTIGNSYTNTNIVAISCNSSYGIGLKIDGKVFVWGTGNDSQDVPLDLGQVIDVACGATHRLALIADGTVIGWGANNSGQLNIPSGLTNVIAISASQYHSVAIKSDGTIVSWGSVAHTNFPSGLTNAFAVAASPNYNLYLYQSDLMSPFCYTRPPAPVTTTNATLRGAVVPNGHPTSAWFEWGLTTAYGNTSAPVYVGTWFSPLQASQPLSNLLAATVYHCRVVVSNLAGVTYGTDQMFRTGSKVSAWGYNDYRQTMIPPGLSNVVAISSGPNSSCALRPDGTVIAWGKSDYGQTNVPPGLSNIVTIASGLGHNLALKQDGTITGWGFNGYGQTTVPNGLSDVVAISAGEYHSLALKSDGSVVAWGLNGNGQTNQVAGLNNIVAISAGGAHNLALRADGIVIAWGADYQDQASVPTGLSNVIAIAAGSQHSLALKKDGSVVAWGANYDNQTNVPAGLSNVVHIAAGVDHSLALRADGSVVVWGRNNYNQNNSPSDVEFCVGLAGGYNHTLALANRPPVAVPQTAPALFNQDTELTLIGTDSNSDQLGFKITTLPTAGALYQFTPTGRGPAITTPNTVVSDVLGRILFAPETNAIGLSYSSFGFVANDGDSDSVPALVTIGIPITQPYALAQVTTPISDTALTFHGVVTPNNSPTTAWFEWGETTSYGQTSPPFDAGSGVAPVRITFAASNLTPGANFHGRLMASNSLGLAIGADFIFTTGEKVYVTGGFGLPALKIPAGLSNSVAVAVGNQGVFALKANGVIVTWGSSTETNVPAGLTNMIAVACTYQHGLALRSNGKVIGWGLNLSGQTTPPVGLSNVIAIAAGFSNSFALRTDGRVVAWGQDVAGETLIPPDLNNVIAIAAGAHHVIALKNDGTVRSWGNNAYSQTNVPSDLTNIIRIAAGPYYSIALRADGTTVAWGGNTSPDPDAWPSLTNIVAISPGSALRTDGIVATFGTANTLLALTNVAGLADSGGLKAFLANLPPVATPKAVILPANFDSAITFSGTDTNTDLLSFKISSFPTNGTLYQFTTNGRGPQILASGSPVTDPLGRVLYAPVSNQFGVALDGFSFTAYDGDADSAPALIQVNITATRPIVHTQASTPWSTNSIQLQGMLLSGNLPASFWFEWGTNAAFGLSTPVQETPLRPEVVPANATLTNLSPLIAYRFRLVASNALGLTYGAEQRFTTGQRLTGWGLNHAGQSAIPLGLTNSVSVQAGGSHSLALRPDGTLVAWGENYTGGPTQPVLSNLIAVASGWYSGLALSSNGTVITWGQNSQLPQPPAPAGLSNIVAIAAGNVHSLALRADGRVLIWGSNESGQTNLPTNLSNVVAIAGGGRHSLALRAGGQVSAWGDNGNGQCTVPIGLSNVIMIAAGDSHSLALRSNGTVVGWGLSSSGQLNPTANPTNLIAIAAGASHSLGLRADGTLLAWGDNTYGQRNLPPGLSNVVSITAGLRHNLAVGNVPPTVLPQTFSGAANTDLLVTLSGSDTNSDALDFRLNSLPGAGKLYQYIAGQRGAALTNQASVSDPQRRLLFAPPANASGSPFTNFTYRANDGQADSATATVTLHIAAPLKPTITQLQRSSNGVAFLTFTGHSNTTYCVWASTNLVTWEYLGLPIQPTNGTFQFVDPTAVNLPQRFYRLNTGCGTPLPQLKNDSTLTIDGFNLHFTGGPYWTYRVWASTNLLNWEMIGTADETQPGAFRFIDATATNWPQRFYKAGSP